MNTHRSNEESDTSTLRKQAIEHERQLREHERQLREHERQLRRASEAQHRLKRLLTRVCPACGNPFPASRTECPACGAAIEPIRQPGDVKDALLNLAAYTLGLPVVALFGGLTYLIFRFRGLPHGLAFQRALEAGTDFFRTSVRALGVLGFLTMPILALMLSPPLGVLLLLLFLLLDTSSYVALAVFVAGLVAVWLLARWIVDVVHLANVSPMELQEFLDREAEQRKARSVVKHPHR